MSGDTTGNPPASTQDALEVLRSDHERLDALLEECEQLAAQPATSSADRSALVSRLGALIGAHQRVEQELFYPLLRGGPQEAEQALAEHAGIETLLQALAPADLPQASFTERLAALAQAVREHVADEEQRLFACLPVDEDLDALGTRLALRRGELLGDQGVD